MAFKNISDQTNGFYIPCVSLFGPGCAKKIGIKAQNLGAKKALIVSKRPLNPIPILIRFRLPAVWQ